MSQSSIPPLARSTPWVGLVEFRRLITIFVSFTRF